jgi:hypothetical protein
VRVIYLPFVTVKNTPEVVVSTYKCEDLDYEWQIVENDGLPEFGQVVKYRAPALLHQGKVISGGFIGVDNEVELGRKISPDIESDFSTVDRFDEIFILNRSTLASEIYSDKFSYVLVPISTISIKDFEMTAKCLYQNINKINENLLENISGRYESLVKKRPVVGVILQDSLKSGGRRQYPCRDGSTAIISQSFGGRSSSIRYYPPGMNPINDYFDPAVKEFLVTMNGTISPYKENLTFLEAGSDPSSVFQGCISPEGESLVDYIHSIPSKIKFFDSDNQVHDLTQVSKIIKNSTSSGISKVDEQVGQASIRIIVPNGGEVLKKNAPININWNEKNIPPNALIYLDLFEISGDHVLLKDDVDSETKYCANCIGGSKAGFTSHHPVGNGVHDVMLEAGKDYYIDNAKPGSHYVLRVEAIESRECDTKNKINYVGEFDASRCDFLIASDWSDSVFTLSD